MSRSSWLELDGVLRLLPMATGVAFSPPSPSSPGSSSSSMVDLLFRWKVPQMLDEAVSPFAIDSARFRRVLRCSADGLPCWAGVRFWEEDLRFRSNASSFNWDMLRMPEVMRDLENVFLIII